MTIRATFQLDADTLSLAFEAQTTKPTSINLSAHPYFNLGGPDRREVLGHEVTIAAEAFLPTDAKQIPTGEIRAVQGTQFDFRQATRLGNQIRQPDPQIFSVWATIIALSLAVMARRSKSLTGQRPGAGGPYRSPRRAGLYRKQAQRRLRRPWRGHLPPVRGPGAGASRPSPTHPTMRTSRPLF